jgi:hypothetical protein
MVRTIFDDEIKLIGKTKLTGFMKLWLYQHYLLSHLAWPFLIHDFPLSFAKELESSIAMVLKRWAGLYRGADNGALFRSNSNFGLGLTSVSHFFKKMQIIKCSLLDDSRDPAVAKVYQLKAQKTSVWKIKWAPHKILKSLSAEAMLNLSFPAQKGKLGLAMGFLSAALHPLMLEGWLHKRRTKLIKTTCSPTVSNLNVKVNGPSGVITCRSTCLGKT